MNAVKTFTFEKKIYFENQIILEFHPPTEFARDTILFIVVRSLSSEQNVIKPIMIWGVIPRVGSPNLPLGFDQNLENPKSDRWNRFLGGHHIQSFKANDPISCMGS